MLMSILSHEIKVHYQVKGKYKMVNNIKDVECPKALLVSCADSLSVIDKTTFDSCVIKGIHVTFWSEDYEDGKERINRMFDTLFDEVVKSRGKIRV